MRAALIGYGTMGRLVYEELGSECAVVIPLMVPIV